MCWPFPAPPRYPPRGGIRILDRQYTEGGRPAIERFVAEEYIIDLLNTFESHRYLRACVWALAAAEVMHHHQAWPACCHARVTATPRRHLLSFCILILLDPPLLLL
jgi:hypothetical protein